MLLFSAYNHCAMPRFKIHRKKAFSLVELVLYVLIVTIITVSMITFVVDLLSIKGQTSNEREVIENLRFVMDKITKDLRSGHSVASGTGTFGTHPGAIRVNTSTGGATYFDLDTNTKTVTVAGSGVTVRYLQISENGGAAEQLTSDSANVTNFVLKNLQRGTEPANIQIQITMEHISGTGTAVGLQTSVSLRR